jgi:undecaprenyl-diphosphatase
MEWWQAAVLGIVQGATEFLPVSSSAHLILVPHLLGWKDQGLAFDVVTHGGTLFAVLAYFRRELVEVVRGSLAALGARRLDAGGRLGSSLVLATVPVGIAGLLAHDWVATSGRNPRSIAVALILFGLLLGAVDRWAPARREIDSIKTLEAFWIGAAQALSLWSGTSRSGVTMTAGRGLGLSRAAAARFSFLLSVPATGLAFTKDLWDLTRAGTAGEPLVVLLAGFAAAALSGYLVIAAFLRWLMRHGLGAFALYRVLLGVLILILL